MADPRMMKMLQQMMAKQQSPEGQVVPETDESTDFTVESPEGEYGTPDEMKALLQKLQGSQPSTEEAEVVPESIDMKKAALEKIKQKYLGQ